MFKLLPFLLFTFLFLFLSNWHVFITTLTGLGEPKAPYHRVENAEWSEFITSKTGVKVTEFYVVNSDRLFGGMTGIPTRPIMTLSRGMVESFTSDELEYVLLHEAGHYALSHSIKEFLYSAWIVVIAFVVWRMIHGSMPTKMGVAMVAGFLIGVIFIQLMRGHEWQADTYTLERLDDPQSMVSATEKLRNAWRGPKDGTWQRKMFNRGIPYDQRIEFANSFEKNTLQK